MGPNFPSLIILLVILAKSSCDVTKSSSSIVICFVLTLFSVDASIRETLNCLKFPFVSNSPIAGKFAGSKSSIPLVTLVKDDDRTGISMLYFSLVFKGVIKYPCVGFVCVTPIPTPSCSNCFTNSSNLSVPIISSIWV